MSLSDHLGRAPLSWVYAIATLILICISLVSLGTGAISITPYDATLALFGFGDNHDQLIVQKLRLPRTALALEVGALMAMSGAMTQGLFRNPLADPSLIGVSAGASAGAGLVIAFASSLSFSLGTVSLGAASLVSIGAFIGGVTAAAFVYRVATNETGTSVSTMLLAGIGITFIAGALSSTLEFIANDSMLRQISLWKMGGVESANVSQVILVGAVLLVVTMFAPRFYRPLNALLLGESEARHLGYETDQIKRWIIILVTASVGISVSMAGMIAFIGLVVPHIIRILAGPRHEFVIPLSGFAGALLLVVADSFARSIIAPSELPLGLVTTAIGVPVFLSLLRHRHHYGMH